MRLRLQVNVIIGVLLTAFATVLIVLQMDDTRKSVADEMQGGNMIAAQLLSRLRVTNPNASLEETRQFLSLVGRIRANEVELRDPQGAVVYRSPPSMYKAGREAPAWYSAIVSPPVKTKTIDLGQGQILLWSDPSRAVLDGWDGFVPMLSTVLIGLVIGNLLVFFLVGRVLEPIARVIHGLRAISQGNYEVRLPTMRGQEAQLMGLAFNAMAQSVQEGVAARERARAATDALVQNRELTKVIQTRIEAVQGQIARELHDEVGQQVTAIKSVGLAIAHRAKGLDAQIESSAHMVVACADAMYEGVHQLVTQLRPLALDRFGLLDALQDLVSQAQSRQPQVRIHLYVGSDVEALIDEVATAAYRIVQESLTNALRHAQASQIEVRVENEADAVRVEIRDDGDGPSPDWRQPGHFGLVGMRERAESLGGTLVFEPLHPRGARVLALLPEMRKINHE